MVRIVFTTPRGGKTHIHKAGSVSTLCGRPASVFGEELPADRVVWPVPDLPWCDVCLQAAPR
jgi:hypothetical protein